MQELVQPLAQEIEDSQLDAVASSLFYGLMIDERTDISVTKQLVLYGWYAYESSEPCSSTFLRVVDLVDGTAEHIEEVHQSILSRVGGCSE